MATTGHNYPHVVFEDIHLLRHGPSVLSLRLYVLYMRKLSWKELPLNPTQPSSSCSGKAHVVAWNTDAMTMA